jgi:peptidoglycan hydrolase-like protein with peptidoglycan-binding domain
MTPPLSIPPADQWPDQVPPGSTGVWASRVQALLGVTGDVDGFVGLQTIERVKAAQKAAGLAEDGVVRPELVATIKRPAGPSRRRRTAPAPDPVTVDAPPGDDTDTD